MRAVIIALILKGFDQKNQFFEGLSWFKFSNMGLALSMTLKFYTSMEKGLKLKIRNCWWLIPTLAEIKGEKLVGRPFWPLI